jgi:putative peptidoglycan lipid II flippase
MNLLKALLQTSSMTLLSRILGYIRDAVVAMVFGAGGLTDAFVVAFRIPNLLRRLFAEGAFSQAYVPILADCRSRQGDEAAHHLVNHVATTLAVIVFITTALGVVFAPQVITLSAPGFANDPDKFQLAAQLLRVTFPYIFFISLVSLASGILNTWNQFWVPAFTPVLLNVAFIFFALVAAPWFDQPIMALAWGAFAGGVLQLLFQVPYLKRIKMLPRPSWNLSDPGQKKIFRLMLPALVGVSVGQISVLISTIFASYLPTGSVSWLFYADRLMEFPTGLLGAALGTILLPSLSRAHTAGNHDHYSELMDWGLRLTLLLTLPAALGLAISGVPLVSTLFMHGAFHGEDVAMVHRALVAYSIGLTGLISVKILAPGFYARQNIKTPVKIAILVLVLTQLMNLAFIGPLQHAGLALATGLGACLNAGLLYWQLRRGNLYQPGPGWGMFLLKLCLGLVVMGLVLWLVQGDDNFWLTSSTTLRAGRLALVVTAAAGAYFSCLWLLGFRLRDFVKRGT